MARISPGAWNPLAKIWGWEVFRNSFWFGMYPDILQPFFFGGAFFGIFLSWLLVASVASVASAASVASMASMAPRAPRSYGSSIIYRSIYQ